MRAHRTLLLVATSLLGVRAAAQCPDGAPPPCRGATSVAAARRPSLRLSASTWIVVPFTNATRTPDLDWVRDASVNLLTLDLERWTDIRVIDDKHVGDLLRDLPPARATQPLTLNDGVGMAKRAGAGRLVMGDYFRVGKGARFVVNVFDVETGKRLRTFTQNATDPDSVLGAFGPIARGVLALAPPPGQTPGATGTTRVDAYQEYLLGTTALNRFAVDTAIVHLRRALALDSAFALAHYKLAVAMHWSDTDTSSDAEAAHALAASRLAGGLPARERALINARLAITSGDYERACGGAGALLAHDSLDVEALYTLGECEYHGGRNPGTPIDSAHGTFRGNWNHAIASFRRVLMLDPSYHPAFAHIVQMLSPVMVVACVTASEQCGNDPATWAAPVMRVGDSLVIHPLHPGSPELTSSVRLATQNRSRVRNLQAAQRIAKDWAEASQRSPRALLNLGILDIQLGEPDASEAALSQIGADADRQIRMSSLYWRLQGAAERADGVTGRKLLELLRTMIRAPADTELHASYAAVFGKLQPLYAVFRRVGAANRWPPERVRYMLLVPRVLLGVPDTGVVNAERAFWSVAAGDSVCEAGLPRCRTSVLLPTLAYGLTLPRTWWPPMKTRPFGFRFEPAWALANHDPGALRASIGDMDSTSRARVSVLSFENSSAAIALDASLALGDSAGALRLARFATDTVLPVLYNSAVGPGAGAVFYGPLMAPRLMLRRAELEAAIGSRDEARVWYDRVLDLWAEADAELQPAIARIRAARAALGSPRG
jgi:TolB-like protein